MAKGLQLPYTSVKAWTMVWYPAVHTCAHIHPWRGTLQHTRVHTYTHGVVPCSTHVYTHTPMVWYPAVHTCTQMHIHMHTRILVLTHAYVHTYTHTHVSRDAQLLRGAHLHSSTGATLTQLNSRTSQQVHTPRRRALRDPVPKMQALCTLCDS
jgi:hypothetical protein